MALEHVSTRSMGGEGKKKGSRWCYRVEAKAAAKKLRRREGKRESRRYS